MIHDHCIMKGVAVLVCLLACAEIVKADNATSNIIEHNVTTSTVGVILLVSSSSEFDSTGSIEAVQTAITDQFSVLEDIQLEITSVVESKQV